MKIEKVWLTEDAVWVRTEDGQEAHEKFEAHPELNASAVARRLGIPQSLFARYIGGTKKPSKERAERILEEIRKIGAELQAAHL